MGVGSSKRKNRSGSESTEKERASESEREDESKISDTSVVTKEQRRAKFVQLFDELHAKTKNGTATANEWMQFAVLLQYDRNDKSAKKLNNDGKLAYDHAIKHAVEAGSHEALMCLTSDLSGLPRVTYEDFENYKALIPRFKLIIESDSAYKSRAVKILADHSAWFSDAAEHQHYKDEWSKLVQHGIPEKYPCFCKCGQFNNIPCDNCCLGNFLPVPV